MQRMYMHTSEEWEDHQIHVLCIHVRFYIMYTPIHFMPIAKIWGCEMEVPVLVPVKNCLDPLYYIIGLLGITFDC